jgi:hypothetical protein
MKGIFGLSTHLDLMKKLECEYEQLTAKPNDAYRAYNFFLTAWHLVEWKYPNPSDTPVRNQLRAQTPLLQICEHLAVGAKHFEPRSPDLDAVASSKKSGVWADGVWAPNVWGDDVWKTWLTVSLSGDAQRMYGDHIRVEELAGKVIEYWRAQI